MNLRRTRYQQGSLTIEKRKNGSDVYVYRWREMGADSQPIRRKQIVGLKSAFASKAAAKRAVEGLRLDINIEAVAVSFAPLTVDQLIDHYRETELCESNSKTVRTKGVYEHQLANVIGPKWGPYRLKDVKPIAVERWLNEMPLAPATRYKTKGIMSVLYQHAMRYEWATSNPI